jgi:hypothetical protein
MCLYLQTKRKEWEGSQVSERELAVTVMYLYYCILCSLLLAPSVGDIK